MQVNAAPDLVSLPGPAVLFEVKVPHDYPWEPPAVTYLPPEGGEEAAGMQAFRQRYTEETGGRLEVRMLILDSPDPRKAACWSRACTYLWSPATRPASHRQTGRQADRQADRGTSQHEEGGQPAPADMGLGPLCV